MSLNNIFSILREWGGGFEPPYYNPNKLKFLVNFISHSCNRSHIIVPTPAITHFNVFIVSDFNSPTIIEKIVKLNHTSMLMTIKQYNSTPVHSLFSFFTPELKIYILFTYSVFQYAASASSPSPNTSIHGFSLLSYLGSPIIKGSLSS